VLKKSTQIDNFSDSWCKKFKMGAELPEWVNQGTNPHISQRGNVVDELVWD